MDEALAPGSNGGAGPVTVVITRQPRRGMEAEFEDWLRGALDEASRFPGHESTSVLLPPPRRKMALVTLVAIYPLVLLSGYALEPALGWMPGPARALVTVALLVVLMTWVVMPWLTRRAYPWLYPETRTRE